MANNDNAPAVELDAEGSRLRLEAEKAKYREAIAKSQQAVWEGKAGSLNSLLPAVLDVPKGEVTLGESAGAYGPWRAHRIIAKTAKKIAEDVKGAIAEPTSEARVLVVDDRSVLQADWTARRVHQTLTRLSDRVGRLDTQLSEGATRLAAAIRLYEQEEAVQNREVGQIVPEGTGRRRTESETEQPPVTGTTTAVTEPGAVPGALGGAIDMLSLLRTDYTFTASSITTGQAELAILTAAQLAAQRLPVEVDVFATVRGSRTADGVKSVLDKRDVIVESISQVQQQLAPVEAELTAINTRTKIIEQEWAAAAADKKNERTTELLRQSADALARRASRRENAAGPARTLVASALHVVAEVDAAVARLLQAREGGEAPLFTAARWERLDSSNGNVDVITHVLYVSLDAVAADVVTRRSIVGTSGVVRFLSAGNASWLLLDVSTGTVVRGGQKSLADAMTFSIEAGTAKYDDTDGDLKNPADTIKDPLSSLETAAKWFVIILAVVLAVIGFISLLAVIRLAFG